MNLSEELKRLEDQLVDQELKLNQFMKDFCFIAAPGNPSNAAYDRKKFKEQLTSFINLLEKYAIAIKKLSKRSHKTSEIEKAVENAGLNLMQWLSIVPHRKKLFEICPSLSDEYVRKEMAPALTRQIDEIDTQKHHSPKNGATPFEYSLSESDIIAWLKNSVAFNLKTGKFFRGDEEDPIDLYAEKSFDYWYENDFQDKIAIIHALLSDLGIQKYTPYKLKGGNPRRTAMDIFQKYISPKFVPKAYEEDFVNAFSGVPVYRRIPFKVRKSQLSGWLKTMGPYIENWGKRGCWKVGEELFYLENGDTTEDLQQSQSKSLEPELVKCIKYLSKKI